MPAAAVPVRRGGLIAQMLAADGTDAEAYVDMDGSSSHGPSCLSTRRPFHTSFAAGPRHLCTCGCTNCSWTDADTQGTQPCWRFPRGLGLYRFGRKPLFLPHSMGCVFVWCCHSIPCAQSSIAAYFTYLYLRTIHPSTVLLSAYLLVFENSLPTSASSLFFPSSSSSSSSLPRRPASLHPYHVFSLLVPRVLASAFSRLFPAPCIAQSDHGPRPSDSHQSIIGSTSRANGVDSVPSESPRLD
ncbi:hypothetical protein V8C26DRAFT_399626 [Trichoderma gracile]